MFYQIDTSSEQKIIGVNNGIYQVELDENSLMINPNYKEIKELLFNHDINKFLDNRDRVFNLKIENLKGKLLANAKITDIMGFSPFIMGFKYIVSKNFVDCLMEVTVNSNEYNLIPIKIDGIEYYLLFIPMIPSSEIVFSESSVYPESEFMSDEKNYFYLKNYNDYLELIKNKPFNRWDKVQLKKQYKDYDIFNIQALSQMFFSEKLTEKLLSKGTTGLIIKNNIKLSFEK